jgi:hypothetical protein
MRKSLIAVATVLSLALSPSIALADAAKPGQSMTHMKTVAGVSSTLEAQGILLYAQGGATAAVVGDSIGSTNGQVVFHIPITKSKTGVNHIGSNIVFFNSSNNKVVQLRNPVIDLKLGVVTAVIPQRSNEAVTVFQITNAANLKATVSNDRRTKLRTKTYSLALSLSAGIGNELSSLLGVPAGSIPENLAFATADVGLYSKLR